MLILIAESKTMSDRESEVRNPQFPMGEEAADELCAELAKKSVAEIAGMLKVSPRLAAASLRMTREFPIKSLGLRTIDAYTGVVFKALDADSLSKDAIDFADRHLLIVSSLYGLLRPTDTIKPYRLDYTSKAAPEADPLWK